MSKKLVSLVLVLALASLVSAGNNQWQGPIGGDWAGSTTYWSLGRLPDASLLDAAILRYADASASSIVVSTSVDGGTKSRMEYGAGTTLTINSGGTITTLGSIDSYNVNDTITINADGAWNAATNGGTIKIAANTGVNANAVVYDVYGSLTANSGTGTATMAITNDSRAGTSLVNSGTVNIYSGGNVDVDNLVIGDFGVGKINIIGTGTMTITGSWVDRVWGFIAAGKIVGGAPVYADGHTIVSVPEPTTVALLGLGSLLLYRKRR